jgi:hypothetical protein
VLTVPDERRRLRTIDPSQETKMVRMNRLAPWFLTAVLAACGTSAKATTGDASGSATNLHYAPGLVVLEEHEADRLLTSIGTDGHVLVFDGATERLRGLQQGQQLMIRGAMAVKVLAVDVQGSQVAVLTEPAALADVITDGEIRFSQPIRFTRGGIVAATEPPVARRWRPTLVQPAYARSGSVLSSIVWGTVTAEVDGWKVAWTATPADGQLDLEITLDKSKHGVDVKIVGEGYLKDFMALGDVKVKDGETDEFLMEARDLNGLMNFRWTAMQEVGGRLLKNETIQLPGAVSIPLAPLVGGLPLFLEISSGVLIKPAFSTRNQISTGHFRVEFDANQSFTVKQGNLDADGTVNGEIELLEHLHVSPLAGMGMVVAFAAPRIDLAFGVGSAFKGLGEFKKPAKLADQIAENLARKAFGEEAAKLVREHGISKALDKVTTTGAKAWFSLTSTAGVFKSGAASMLPCERHWMIVTGSVGVTGNFLGTKAERVVAEVYHKEDKLIDPPTPFCESAG